VRVNEVWEKDFGNVAVYTDNVGNVGIGTASPEVALHLLGSSFESSSMSFERTGSGVNDDAFMSFIRDNTSGDGDRLGVLAWRRRDSGGAADQGARIRAEIDGTPSDTDIPTKLDFFTTDSTPLTNSSVPRLTVEAAGQITLHGTQDYHWTTRSTAMAFQSQTAANAGVYEFFTNDGDGTDAIQMALYGLGTPASITNRERLVIRGLASGNYEIFTESDGTGTLRPLILYTEGNSNQLYLNTDGNVGIGTASPQGIIHSYDSIGGFLVWEYDGLDATVRTAIPNGSGDVLYRLHASYVLRDSATAVASGTTDVSNGASVNLTVGANTVRLRVNADGSCDVARTAGTDTIKVNLVLTWL
jgi:hypothetical protein